MKSLFLLFILAVCSQPGWAQNDSTVTYLDNFFKPCSQEFAVWYSVKQKENDHWKKVIYDARDKKPSTSTYYLDAACTMNDGPYAEFNKEGRIVANGNYKDNKRVGPWTRYADTGALIDSAFYKDDFIFGKSLSWNKDGRIVDSLVFGDNGDGSGWGFWQDGKLRDAGPYKAGKKNGAWTYYYRTGMKSQEVTYIADSATTVTCYDEAGSVQSRNCVLEKEAAFKGGDKAWNKYLVRGLTNARYPTAYYRGKLFGTVIILFVVDLDGRVTDARPRNSLSPEMDRIAVMIIEQSPPWEPAIQYNRPVKAYRLQPVTFVKAE